MPACLAFQRDTAPRLQRAQSMSPSSPQPLGGNRAGLIGIAETPLGS